jgi:hypothetical protein
MRRITLSLVTALIFFVSCKKQEVCNRPTYWYYYYKYNGSAPTDYLGGEFISQCDDEKLKNFVNNKPAGYSVGYRP